MNSSLDMTFDHIGIVCISLKFGRDFFGRLLNITTWTAEFADPVNQVYVQFGYQAPNICYEIISPFGETSPIRGALKDSTRILNHVAYRVSNLETHSAHFREQRCVAAGPPRPAIAYHNHRIQFFMTPLGFLIELIEAPHHHHIFLTDQPPVLTSS